MSSNLARIEVERFALKHGWVPPDGVTIVAGSEKQIRTTADLRILKPTNFGIGAKRGKINRSQTQDADGRKNRRESRTTEILQASYPGKYVVNFIEDSRESRGYDHGIFDTPDPTKNQDPIAAYDSKSSKGISAFQFETAVRLEKKGIPYNLIGDGWMYPITSNTPKEPDHYRL